VPASVDGKLQLFQKRRRERWAGVKNQTSRDSRETTHLSLSLKLNTGESRKRRAVVSQWTLEASVAWSALSRVVLK
jgi:hypothetical protein